MNVLPQVHHIPRQTLSHKPVRHVTFHRFSQRVATALAGRCVGWMTYSVDEEAECLATSTRRSLTIRTIEAGPRSPQSLPWPGGCGDRPMKRLWQTA